MAAAAEAGRRGAGDPERVRNLGARTYPEEKLDARQGQGRGFVGTFPRGISEGRAGGAGRHRSLPLFRRSVGRIGVTVGRSPVG